MQILRQKAEAQNQMNQNKQKQLSPASLGGIQQLQVGFRSCAILIHLWPPSLHTVSFAELLCMKSAFDVWQGTSRRERDVSSSALWG